MAGLAARRITGPAGPAAAAEPPGAQARARLLCSDPCRGAAALRQGANDIGDIARQGVLDRDDDGLEFLDRHDVFDLRQHFHHALHVLRVVAQDKDAGAVNSQDAVRELGERLQGLGNIARDGVAQLHDLSETTLPEFGMSMCGN